MNKTVIAIDIDGTLRCNHTETCQDTNDRVVKLIVILAHMKNTVLIAWSGGGAKYAEHFVRSHDLHKYFTSYWDKIAPPMQPDIAIDDQQAFNMGKVNLIVREK